MWLRRLVLWAAAGGLPRCCWGRRVPRRPATRAGTVAGRRIRCAPRAAPLMYCPICVRSICRRAVEVGSSSQGPSGPDGPLGCCSRYTPSFSYSATSQEPSVKGAGKLKV